MTNKFNDESRRNMGGAEINEFSVSKPRLSRPVTDIDIPL
jgi:hypothetical protein